MLEHVGTPAQPECPLRIEQIHKYLNENGLLDQMDPINIFESEVKVDGDGKSQYPVLTTIHTRDEVDEIIESSEKLEDGKI